MEIFLSHNLEHKGLKQKLINDIIPRTDVLKLSQLRSTLKCKIQGGTLILVSRMHNVFNTYNGNNIDE